ncbi:MAG: anaerobic ribonucleoside-triphosphate reductase activating protein [Patescibacteria group bacterium]|nr:anaerobic ribonucleoside-triphosphate reductase activating protein [Patescibacteria group bacterium]
MFIGGLQKFTLLDYPGKIAAVIFTVGCNFRCPFCHNPELVDPKEIDYENKIEEKEILKFLNSRKEDLDGFCITGGEPTLQLDLTKFIKKVKKLGFSVKLDTNGSYPNVVKNLVENKLVDYVAIDVKTIPEKYDIMTSEKNIIEKIEKSIKAVVNSSSDLELRTTVVPGITIVNDFDKIARWINNIDQKAFSKLSRYSIQNFRKGKTLQDDFKNVKPYSKEELEEMAEKIRKYCKNVVIAD